MRGNSFGKMITMSSFGESHGSALGVVIDGVPANLKVDLNDLQAELDRRAPGKQKGTTARKEADKAEVLSGIFEGVTLGTPIAVIVRNSDQRSEDYDQLKDSYRPGHADKTTIMKYGIRDHRGGGRSSGRETIGRVIAGYFASLIIPDVSMTVAPVMIGELDSVDQLTEQTVSDYLSSLQKKGESVGGKVKVVVKNCLEGLGEPVFDKLKADLAKALLSIGGCVSFSYGLGEKFANSLGSEISSDVSNFGGIEGGISNGEDIELELTFKPPSTVGKNATNGRHDPCIIPRVIPVVEAMVKFVLADHYLRQKAYAR